MLLFTGPAFNQVCPTSVQTCTRIYTPSSRQYKICAVDAGQCTAFLGTTTVTDILHACTHAWHTHTLSQTCLTLNRVFYDARGEEDLRGAETSALAVVSGPIGGNDSRSAVHAFLHPTRIKQPVMASTSGGAHMKGILSW